MGYRFFRMQKPHTALFNNVIRCAQLKNNHKTANIGYIGIWGMEYQICLIFSDL